MLNDHDTGQLMQRRLYLVWFHNDWSCININGDIHLTTTFLLYCRFLAT